MLYGYWTGRSLFPSTSFPLLRYPYIWISVSKMWQYEVNHVPSGSWRREWMLLRESFDLPPEWSSKSSSHPQLSCTSSEFHFFFFVRKEVSCKTNAAISFSVSLSYFLDWKLSLEWLDLRLLAGQTHSLVLSASWTKGAFIFTNFQKMWD